jgi:hypothetical protein
VANLPRRTPAAAKAVFINCPFDDRFKVILRAMVFTIISSGYHPRCALDISDGADIRIGKIARMIGECDWAIHDLSRVETTRGLPRFNMAMELGVHLGARLLGKGRHRHKRALILDAEPHRYDQALSDISGQDIDVHKNKPNEAIRCVRDWLSPYNSPPLPGADAIQDDYRVFLKDIRKTETLTKLRLHPDKLTHPDFLHIVRDWITVRAIPVVNAGSD